MEAASTGKETKDFDVPKTIEYRKVGANGELGETVFDRNAIDNSQMSYFRRPSGYDYYSTILSDKAERYQEKKTEADAVEKAKQAVNDFENFQITTLEEARQFKQKFSDTQALVEAVSGSKEKKEFRRKLAKHYKALNKAYKKTWKTRIKEADEQAEKEQEMNAQAAAEDNAISAQKKLHDQRVKYMEWYLDKLETRKYNTTVTQQLLEDAKNCLSNCSSYEEYDSLKRKLDDQENASAALLHRSRILPVILMTKDRMMQCIRMIRKLNLLMDRITHRLRQTNPEVQTINPDHLLPLAAIPEITYLERIKMYDFGNGIWFSFLFLLF